MISKKSHLLLWCSIPLILLFGFLSKIPSFDINFKDTYYVIDPFSISILLSIFLGLTGFGYLILNIISDRELRWLKTTQLILTFIGIFFLGIGLDGHFNALKDKENTIDYIQLLSFGVFAFIVSQILFLLIFVIALKRKS